MAQATPPSETPVFEQSAAPPPAPSSVPEPTHVESPSTPTPTPPSPPLEGRVTPVPPPSRNNAPPAPSDQDSGKRWIHPLQPPGDTPDTHDRHHPEPPSDPSPAPVIDEDPAPDSGYDTPSCPDDSSYSPDESAAPEPPVQTHFTMDDLVNSIHSLSDNSDISPDDADSPSYSDDAPAKTHYSMDDIGGL